MQSGERRSGWSSHYAFVTDLDLCLPVKRTGEVYTILHLILAQANI